MTERKDDSSDRLTQLAQALKQLASTRSTHPGRVDPAFERVLEAADLCGLYTPDEASIEIEGKKLKLDLRESEVSPHARLAAVLSVIQADLPKIWPQYLEWRRANVVVEKSFEQEYEVTDRVLLATQELLYQVASGLRAFSGWEPLLRAFEGLKGSARGDQEKQARVAEKCKHALDAWNALGSERRKRRDESKDAHEARLRGTALRSKELRIATVLLSGLREHEPLFAKSSALTKQWVRETLSKKRANMSPHSFLHLICVRADVWGDVSEQALKQASWAQRKKRQPVR